MKENEEHMKVVRSRHAGACYGVERALSLVDEAAANARSEQGDTEPVHTLGPLIHNPQVVSELKEQGVEVAATVDEVKSGILVIRSHGVVPSLIEDAQDKGLRVFDATCPHVSKTHAAARELRESGHLVVIVGEPGHPEVEGIQAYAGDDALVAQSADDLPAELARDKVGVVAQTTQAKETLDAVVAALRERGIEPLVRNTICFATKQRQETARELAEQADVMLVVGGRNSGNTTRLAEICAPVCPRTYHVESPDELDPTWFEGAETVGITAGASTPENQIIAVEKALLAHGKQRPILEAGDEDA
ncbi:MAG: 4-hydroxy-3-methylbut-2-enyl diphosphate reductase [Coriobacteriales bacterium]|jgi:4-hydroxy-3-methylbut-2-enyl diphosphate reductase|nr:4-hydroxy-3-methylbut-2-enyl diphosphate reductase [Coriobacteriales bacterium]